jgi:predicted membrane protein
MSTVLLILVLALVVYFFLRLSTKNKSSFIKVISSYTLTVFWFTYRAIKYTISYMFIGTKITASHLNKKETEVTNYVNENLLDPLEKAGGSKKVGIKAAKNVASSTGLSDMYKSTRDYSFKLEEEVKALLREEDVIKDTVNEDNKDTVNEDNK